MKHQNVAPRVARGALVSGALAVSLLLGGTAFAEPGHSRQNSHSQAGQAGAQFIALSAQSAPKAESTKKNEEAEGKAANPGAASLAHRKAAKGTIKSLDTSAKSFVLATKAGDLTVTTNAETKYQAAQDGATFTFSSLRVGLAVQVQGDRPNETTLLAKHIRERAPKKEDETEHDRTSTVGVVSDLAADRSSFKVTPSGGTALTLKITADTVITERGTAVFANGATVRVVSEKDASGNAVALRIRVPANS